jgi:cell division protein FtsQ
MEIKTTKSRDTNNARIVPPPDRAGQARKKANRKLGNSRVAGRRFASALKTFGKACSFLLVIAFALSIFVFAYTSEKFNLRQVTFYGCKELDPKALESIIRQDFPSNILRINLQKLKNRLEKETWAKSVEIRRVLPSDLVLRVEERTPAVVFEFNNELMIADRDGIALGFYDPRFGKLDTPVFKGMLGENAEGYQLYQEENSARIRQGLRMLAEIESDSPQSTKQISEVDLSDPQNLKMLLVNDTVEVMLGEKEYVKRFRKLMQYRNLREQYDALASIDVRFDGKIIYHRRGQGIE